MSHWVQHSENASTQYGRENDVENVRRRQAPEKFVKTEVQLLQTKDCSSLHTKSVGNELRLVKPNATEVESSFMANSKSSAVGLNV